jgi:hypothetical protein
MKSRKTKLLGAAIALWALGCAPLPAQPKRSMTAQEQAILKFVLDWWREGFVARHPEMVKKYFADNFIQPTRTSLWAPPRLKKCSAAGCLWRFSLRCRDRKCPCSRSQGDLVTLVFEREAPDPQDPSKNYKYNAIDIFRVATARRRTLGRSKGSAAPQKKK